MRTTHRYGKGRIPQGWLLAGMFLFLACSPVAKAPEKAPLTPGPEECVIAFDVRGMT